ncbi:hypothetical protein GIB67_039848 [Kingdonia uniflora]|uniref:Uncharacterized protein n=1 Tax=Kingdonia uniflora TaxID=39325 RepID=A0A7J7P365_9MAGN|nr:hypothetical protein GIB67_039848 [Kingdonia uniflora]
MEQSPIPLPIHVGRSHEYFDTSGGGYVVGKNSTKFMSHFGNLVREHILAYYPDWQAVSLKLKDSIWETICDEYVLPQAEKKEN